MSAPIHELTTEGNDSTAAGGGTFDLTHNGFATPRSNRFALVTCLSYAFNETGTPGRDVTAITYDGVAMTSAGSAVRGGVAGDRGVRMHLYYLVAPNEGNVTVHFTVSAGAEAEPVSVSIHTFYDVNQSTPFDGYTTANASSDAGPATVTLSGTAGDLAYGAGGCGQTQTLTITTSGATELGTAGGHTKSFNGDTQRLACMSAPSGASIVPSWTIGAASNWVAATLNIKALAATAITDDETGTLTDTGAQERTGPWYQNTTLTISPYVGFQKQANGLYLREGLARAA